MHTLRGDLATNGIPTSGVVGFEICNGKQYGLTEVLQNGNSKRALEGELTKSIETLAGIQSARVHLVMPKSSIFKKLQTEATASVVVSLRRAASLAEVIDACRADFPDSALHARLRNAPKFGNGDPSADRWTGRVMAAFAACLDDAVNHRGGAYAAGLSAVTAHRAFFPLMRATSRV